MSLYNEINRVNSNKDKTKTVSNNINNKLVEVGGEKALNLFDVPNKINKTIKDNYKRIARFSLNQDITYSSGLKTVKVPLNLNFKPDEIIIRYGCGSNPNIITSSRYSYNQNTMSPADYNRDNMGKAYIKNITSSSCDVVFDFASNNIGGTDHHYLYDLIAIE